MKKIFKIVRGNGYNSDQDLMSFFDDWTKFLKEVFPTLGLDINKTMAVVNNTPSEELCKMVRETFKNVWSYYPSL